MHSNQTKIVFIAIIVAIFAWLVSPLLFSAREQTTPLSQVPLSFDASAAFRLTQDLVTQVPRRVLGSLESRQSTGFIQEYLEKLGYSTSYTHFDARVAGRRQVGRNILAYKQAQSPEILALVAHLDTAKTTNQGAMDNGSGVGVLLELARVFTASPTKRSLLLLFSDGEEWGMLGTRDLASNYPDRDRIAAVLSLDHVGIGDLEAFCLEETGQLKGFSPPWLRLLARRAAETQGLPVRSASGFSEYLDRAFLISWADQGPFLSQGIPAINLGSESKERVREKEIYHSERDTIENLKPASIGAYGRAAERIVRTLDELSPIPKTAPDAFSFWDSRFVRSGAIFALQILSLLPLALAFFFYLTNHRGRLARVEAAREYLAFLGTVVPFWLIPFLIALARALRLLPVYTLYPATIKDPVLEHPAWNVLAGILGTALFVALVCFIIAKFSFQGLPKPDFHASKLVLLSLLLIGIACSLFYNSYWASFFFLLPAWIWPLTGNKGSGSRVRDWTIILAAGIPYYGALWFYASRMNLGWNFVWYQILALGNGLFTNAAYLLATAIIAVGIRFLAIQSQERRS